MTTKITAAQHSRSHAVPAGPMEAKTGVDAAAPIWTVKMEQRANRTPVEVFLPSAIIRPRCSAAASKVPAQKARRRASTAAGRSCPEQPSAQEP